MEQNELAIEKRSGKQGTRIRKDYLTITGNGREKESFPLAKFLRLCVDFLSCE